MSEVFVTNMAYGATVLRIIFVVIAVLVAGTVYKIIRLNIRDFQFARKKSLNFMGKVKIVWKVLCLVFVFALYGYGYYICFHCCPSEGKWTKVVTTIESKEPLSYDELTIKARDSLADVEDQIEGEFLRWEIRAVVKEESNDSRNP